MRTPSQAARFAGCRSQSGNARAACGRLRCGTLIFQRSGAHLSQPILYVGAATSRSREKSRIPQQRALPGSPADRLVPARRDRAPPPGKLARGHHAVRSCVLFPRRMVTPRQLFCPAPPAPPRPPVPDPLCPPPAPRASAACRAPCAPCFNKNGVDIPVGGHRIRGGTYFPLLKRFVGLGTSAPQKARWRPGAVRINGIETRSKQTTRFNKNGVKIRIQ